VNGQTLVAIQHRDRLAEWFFSFPTESLVRLKKINSTTNSATHVLLALAYGTFDRHINGLNRMITGLLVARMKAQRKCDHKTVVRINDFMEQIHEQIDASTGVKHERSNHEVCNRPRQKTRLS